MGAGYRNTKNMVAATATIISRSVAQFTTTIRQQSISRLRGILVAILRLVINLKLIQLSSVGSRRHWDCQAWRTTTLQYDRFILKWVETKTGTSFYRLISRYVSDTNALAPVFSQFQNVKPTPIEPKQFKPIFLCVGKSGN